MNPKTLLIVFFSAVFSFSFYFSSITESFKFKSKDKIFYTDDMVIPHSAKTGNVNYVYRLIPPPQDTIPYLSTFTDYATNGNTLKQLVVKGDTIIASCTYVDSAGAADPNNHNSLALTYNYSFNGGNTWGFTGRTRFTAESKSRFGDINMLSRPTAVATGRFWNPPLNSTVRKPGASEDVILGGGTFIETRLEGTLGYDLYSSVRADDNLACIVKIPSSSAGGYDTIYYTTYAGTFSPLKVLNVSSLNNNACSYSIAASPINANHLTAVYCYINEPNVNLVPATIVRTSTNGGVNWSNPVEIAPTGIINGDSSGCFWHEDIAYKPGTNECFVVFSTDNYAPSAGPDEYRKAFKICIWNQTLNGGLPVVIADWHNVPILSNNDLFYRIRNFHINSRVVNHPSIGFKSDGSRMFVAFSVCQVDTSSLGFTYEDIFYSYSDNGGMNWSTPVNMTNTTNQVEKYPIVPKVFTGSLPPVMYQWDQVPGCQSFTDLAPVNRVYWVLKRDVLSSASNSEMNSQPIQFSLHQNYPNPFNPSTKIRFEIPARVNNDVQLKIFDILGREVRSIVNENLKPGVYEAEFNAAELPSGVYFYKLTAGDFSETKKMILMK